MNTNTPVICLEGASNYGQWVWMIQTTLEGIGLWEIANGTIPEPAEGASVENISKWRLGNAKCKSVIVTTLNQRQIDHIHTCQTAHEVLELLRKIYSDSSNLNIDATMNAFFTFQIAEHESAVDGFMKIESLSRSLKDMGETVGQKMLMQRIIAALPKSRFASFKEAWQSVSKDDQTMENLLTRIKNIEFQQQQEGIFKPEESAAFYSGYKGKGYQRGKGNRGGRGRGKGSQSKHQDGKEKRCYNCDSPDHFARDCDKPRQSSSSQDGTQGNNYDKNRNSSSRGHGRGSKGNGRSQGGRSYGKGGHQSNYNEVGDDTQRTEENADFAYNTEVTEEYESDSNAFLLEENELEFNESHEEESTTTNISMMTQLDPEAYMGLGDTGRCRTRWILDSGASQHICGDRGLFIEFTPLENALSVKATGNKTVSATGVGRVELLTLDAGEWKTCTLKDVLYIENSANLFSTGVLTGKGFHAIYNEREAFFVKNNKQGPWADKVGNMYVMRFRRPERCALYSQEDKQMLIHNRLAHICIENIRLTAKHEAASGIKVDDLKGDFFCHCCHLGKSSRNQNTRLAEKQNCSPGEILHTDLSGPHPQTLGGKRYLMVTFDECSRLVCTSFLQNKSEASNKIKNMIAFFERQTGNKVKVLRTDNAREYLTKELQSFLEENGVIHGLSPAYCPQQNGIIERQMRRVKELANTLLRDSNLGKHFWAEACAFSAFVLNRTVNKSNPEKTPYEHIFKRKPHLGKVRRFGADAYVHIPDTQRKDWEPKAFRGTLVGMDAETNYRVYNPATKTIRVYHDVKFNEEFGKMLKIQASEQDNMPVITPKQEEEEGPIPLDESEIFDNSDDWTEAEEGNLTIENSPNGAAIPRNEDAGGNFDDTLIVATPAASSTTPVNEKNIKVTVKKGNKIYEGVVNRGTTSTISLRPNVKKPEKYALLSTSVFIPSTYKEAMECDDNAKWKESIQSEMTAMMENGVFEIVNKPENTKLLDSRYVFRIKYKPDGSIDSYKTRLVIRGFMQQHGIDFFNTFTNVARLESIRLILAIAVKQKYEIRSLDITTAFLQGNLNETIFMKIPEGFPSQKGKVCLLKRPLYGLRQAPFQWSERLNEYLKTLKFTQSKYDPCVYIYTQDDIICFLVCYVDDIFMASPKKEFLSDIIGSLKTEFKLRETKLNSFVGIEIEKFKDGSIFLHNTRSISDLVEKYGLQNCNPSTVPMQPNVNLQHINPEDTETTFPYLQVIGSLLFLARTTRIDICYATAKLAQFGNAYDAQHWKALKSVLRYLQGCRSEGILYDSADTSMKLIAYSDSDYANDKHDRKSITGYTLSIGNAPIAWKAQKQPIVTTSSTEAELVALTEAAKEVVYFRNFMTELGFSQEEPTPIFVDNTSAITLAEHHTLLGRSKHIDVKYFFTRELVKNRILCTPHVSTNEQKADILTKPLPRTKYVNMKRSLSMYDMDEAKDITQQHEKDEQQQPKKRKTASVPSSHLSSPWSMLSLLLMVSVIQGGSATDTELKMPVLWKKTATPVVTGYMQLEIKIVLLNPCSLLSESIIHKDLLNQALAECSNAYNNSVIANLETMCPDTRAHWDTHVIQKREIFTIIGVVTVISAVVAGAGISITAIVKAVNNENKIQEIEEKYNAITKNVIYLEEAVNNTDVLLFTLEKKFNQTVLHMVDHETDFEEMKYKSVAQAYAISSVVSKLQIGKTILLETARKWKEGKMHLPFFDYLNLTLPYHDMCAMEYIKPDHCEFHGSERELFITLDVPMLNPNFEIVAADPFLLMEKRTNETCTKKYQGPLYAVVSNDTDCIHPLMSTAPVLEEVMVYPVNQCRDEDTNAKQLIAYDTVNCVPAHPLDHLHFIQLKKQGSHLFIYCPLSTITIAGKRQPCPDYVFSLPLNTHFIINNIRYDGRVVKLKTHEIWSPLYTSKVNWYLFKKDEENLKSLFLNETIKPLEKEDFEDMKPFDNTADYSLHTFVAVVFTATLILGIWIVSTCIKKKTEITVEDIPLRNHQH